MTKRTKKEQRIAAEKAALRQRIEDLVCGAWGWKNAPSFLTEHDLTITNDLSPKAFGAFLCALVCAFPGLDDAQNYRILKVQQPYNFDVWDRPWPEVIDKLYEGGLRA